MKSLKISAHLSLLLLAVAFLSSCESSKIAFGNSYYFKQTPKSIDNNQPQAKNTLEETETASEEVVPSEVIQSVETPSAPAKAYVSAESVIAEKSIKEKIEKVENRIEKLKKLDEQAQAHAEQNEALSKKEKKAFKKEQKAEAKALKKEMKVLAKEYKKAPEEVKEKLDVSGNTRTGIIIGAAGLVLLIIGGPVLWTLGSILVVVGLVLILIDVL